MGSCISKTQQGGSDEEKAANKAAEEQLQKDLEDATMECKVLLLGAGESGKSTVVKQIKAIRSAAGKMSDEECKTYTKNMHENTIQVLHQVLQGAEDLHIDEEMKADPVIKDFIDEFKELQEDTTTIEPTLATKITTFWESEFVQNMWKERNRFYILDAAPYYFNNVDRFAEEDFMPTEEDAIMARVRTTGIVVSEFSQEGMRYRIVDVGGQRNERRKWIHCFDDVKAIIFCCSLIGYNQVLFEDAKVNRMQESIKLFAEIANKPAFADKAIFLFFNKKDLFSEELANAPLSRFFVDYKEPEEEHLRYNHASDFILQQYLNELTDKTRKILHFVVAARLRKDMKDSWKTVHMEMMTLAKRGKKK